MKSTTCPSSDSTIATTTTTKTTSTATSTSTTSKPLSFTSKMAKSTSSKLNVSLAAIEKYSSTNVNSKVRSTNDSSNLLTTWSSRRSELQPGNKEQQQQQLVTRTGNNNNSEKSNNNHGNLPNVSSKIAPRATLSEIEGGTLSLSRSSSNLSLPDVTIDLPMSPTEEATETAEIDIIETSSSRSSASSSSSSSQSNSTASLEVCCCEVTCDRDKWTRVKDIYRCPRKFMIQVNQSQVKKRLLMALASLCTGLDPISKSNFYPSASSLLPPLPHPPPHPPISSPPFDDASSHPFAPCCCSSSPHPPLQYPHISSDLNTGHHSWSCPAVHSINCSITPEETEPMLPNESQINSIDSNTPLNSTQGNNSSHLRGPNSTRYPLSRSPGRSRLFHLPSSITSESNISGNNPNNNNNNNSNHNNNSTAVVASLDHQLTQRQSGTLQSQQSNISQQQQPQQQQQQHQQSSNQSSSIHHHHHHPRQLTAPIQPASSNLCQVCIPLGTISTSTNHPGQIGCYLCNSTPTPGHTLNRNTTGNTTVPGQLTSTSGTMGPPMGGPSSVGASLIPKTSNMPLDMNIYATRKTIAQGMLDICLMISNATQLKYLLLHAPRHKYVEATIALITLSIVLQVIIGIILIFQGRWNINYRGDQRKADIANNIVVILIFLVTVVNVMASAFGPSELPSGANSSTAATTATIAFLPSSPTTSSLP